MPANRCSFCSINYPTHYPNNFADCPVCDSKLDRFEYEEVDEDWKGRSEYLRSRLERLGEAAPLVPMIKGNVLERDGILRLSSYDVSDSDVWSTLVPEEIVQVGDRFYEVEGYLDSSREYVVSEFSLELDVPVLDAEPKRLVEGGSTFSPNVKILRDEARAERDAA